MRRARCRQGRRENRPYQAAIFSDAILYCDHIIVLLRYGFAFRLASSRRRRRIWSCATSEIFERRIGAPSNQARGSAKAKWPSTRSVPGAEASRLIFVVLAPPAKRSDAVPTFGFPFRSIGHQVLGYRLSRS